MKKILCVLICLFASGCLVRQNIKFGGDVRCEPKERMNVSVRVDVTDERPYVVNGEDSPYFIGHYRGGFGNPFNVGTYENKPLARIFRDDLERELACLGFDVAENGADRIFAVGIRDWRFDTFQNADMWYDIGASVKSSDNTVLVSDSIKDRKYIQGSFWTGPKSAVEENVPILYEDVLSRLLRKNDKVLGALKKK